MDMKLELLYLKVLRKGRCSAMVSSRVKSFLALTGCFLMGYIRKPKRFRGLTVCDPPTISTV